MLDPEAKVVIEEPGGIIHVRDKELWKAYVSNTWISPEQIKVPKEPSMPTEDRQYFDETDGKIKVLRAEKIKKPIGSARVDYNKQNYCARCQIKYNDKKILRCSECGNRLRTKPWHGRSNFANGGKILMH